MPPYSLQAAVLAVLFLPLSVGVTAQSDRDSLEAFHDRVNWYVQIHRQMEGPVPPLEVTQDMEEVQRRMRAVRVRILSKTGRLRRGHIFTRDATQMMRRHIAAVLTREDMKILLADVVEHTPPAMPALRLQEPLPQDAPFVAFPPRLFPRLPALPAELRYLVLEKALVLWDHHADLVVDIAPGLFDPAAYPETQPPNSKLQTPNSKLTLWLFGVWELGVWS
jgi:hypothetical protein